MKELLFIFLAVLLASCSSGETKSKKGNSVEAISLDVKKYTLDNGLTLLVVENHKLPIFSFYSFYKVGGKYEEKGMTGASHFLEHMMFKGAKKYQAGDFDKMVEGNGGSNNAYTTNDLTVYYENLPSAHINTIIDLEADRMENLALEPDSFEKERKVILEERKMRYENSDRGKIFLSLMEQMYAGTAYGTSVIGDVADLKSVTRDQIHTYFKKFYAPNNAILVIVGNVNAEKVYAEIKDKFGKIPPNEKLAESKHKILQKLGVEFKGKYNREMHLHGTSPSPMVMMGFQAKKIGERDAFVLDMLINILAQGKSSYLNQKLVEVPNAKFSNLYGFNYSLQESGMVVIAGNLSHGKDIKAAKTLLISEIKKGCLESITERNLQKVKNNFLVSVFRGLDTNAGVAQFIGERETHYGDYQFYKKEFAIYEDITVAEVQSACEKYLDINKSIYLSIWNNNKKD